MLRVSLVLKEKKTWGKISEYRSLVSTTLFSSNRDCLILFNPRGLDALLPPCRSPDVGVCWEGRVKNSFGYGSSIGVLYLKACHNTPRSKAYGFLQSFSGTNYNNKLEHKIIKYK